MKSILITSSLLIVLAACNNNTTEKNTTATTSNDTAAHSSTSFFPVPDFIGGQIKMVDSLQMPLTKTVTINKKSTLTSLSDAEFKSLAQHFREPDINDPTIKKFYKEESFADQSVPSVTLTYSTTSTSMEIQRMDIVVKPDPIQNDKVSSIYIEKLFHKNDTLITEKLYWKANKNFLVVTDKQVGGKSLPVEQVKVVWDPTE